MARAAAPAPPETHIDPDPSDPPGDDWDPEAEAVVEEPSSDWLDRICPYLLSEDGTSRSAQPDPRHRCMAQEPPGTLPLLFQERFCLTDRHVRCEMYKQAEGARSMALAQDSIPAEQVRSARFRPSVRSRPIALEPDSTGAVASKASPFAARPVAFGVLGAAGLAIVLMALALLFGGFGSPPPGEASPSAPLTTPAPVPTSTPTARPTATPEGPQVTRVARDPILIRYQLQEGERVLRVAEKWGTSRLAIVQANPDGDPREARAGDVILVPVPPGTPADAIEATPGFLGYVEE